MGSRPPKGSRPPQGWKMQKKPLIFLGRKRRARSVRSKCRQRRPEIVHMRRKTKDLVFGIPPLVTAAAATATATSRRSLLRGPGPVHHSHPGAKISRSGSLTPIWMENLIWMEKRSPLKRGRAPQPHRWGLAFSAPRTTSGCQKLHAVTAHEKFVLQVTSLGP